MTLRRHCISMLAAAFVLTAPAALAQEHGGGAKMDKAPELPNFTEGEAKAFIKQLTTALENDAKAEPPKQGERPRRPEAFMVTARAPYIARGLGSNKHMPEEIVEMIVGELESLKEEYPDQTELLDKEIFKVSNLTIGREAPNIKGVDTDEVEFELKDYRGKVVVIDFWGDW